jgi:hypothetical protein
VVTRGFVTLNIEKYAEVYLWKNSAKTNIVITSFREV